MVMGQPVTQTGESTLVRHGEARDGLLYKLSIDLGGGCEDRSIPQTPPERVKMIGKRDWDFFRENIEDHRKSNGFYNCPCLEATIFLTCCCACVMCPVSLCVGDYAKRENKLKGKTLPEINEKFRKYGMRCEYQSGIGGEYIAFRAL